MILEKRWLCLVENSDEFFENEFDDIVKTSQVIDVIEDQNDIDNKTYVLSNASKNKPIGIITYIDQNEIKTSYPVANIALEYEVFVEDLIQDKNTNEHYVYCSIKNDSSFLFGFFNNLPHKDFYSLGEYSKVYLSGLVNSASQTNFDFNLLGNDSKEQLYLTKDSVVFIPNQDADYDTYKLISPILEVEVFNDVFGVKVYKLIVYIHRDNFEIKIPIMISEHNLENGFIPEVGKSINCGLWLCGVSEE